MGHNSGDNIVLLSDILKSCHRFSFFHELLNLKQLEQTASGNGDLASYDLMKIASTVKEITEYLASILQVFQEVDQADIAEKNSVNWIFEGRQEIVEVTKNIASIDDIISQLLILLENKLVNDETATDENAKLWKILETFEAVGDLSLQVKKFTITYKKRLDVAVAYHELDTQIIGGIDNELNDCLKQSFKIQELKLATPYKKSKAPIYEDWDLLKLHTRLNQTGLKLPIFDEVDQQVYDQYVKLEEHVKPLNMSLDFVPLTMENFKMASQDLYPELIDSMMAKHALLQEKIGFLNADLKKLESELLIEKWTDIFEKLLREALILLKDLQSCKLERLDQATTYKISMQEKTFRIMAKICKLRLHKLSSEISDEYHHTTRDWEVLQEKFSKMEKEPLTRMTDDERMQVLSTVKRGVNVFEILPDFLRRDHKLKEAEKAHSASPSKVTRRQAVGGSISSSMGIQPVYIDKTPVSTFVRGVKLIDTEDLSKLKKSNVSDRLKQEINVTDDDSSCLASLTKGVSELKVSSAKPLNEDAERKKLQELLQSSKNITQKRSKIPVPKQRVTIRHSLSNSNSRPPSSTGNRAVQFTPKSASASLVNSRPPSSMGTRTAQSPSMIPRPVSVCSSRFSSATSSRSSSRASSRETEENSSPGLMLPPLSRPWSACSSSSSKRSSLGNITNLTNNKNTFLAKNATRHSMAPQLRTDKRSGRRPASSLSNIRPIGSRCTSLGSSGDEVY